MPGWGLLRWLSRVCLVCHCLACRDGSGLIDTGFGLRDIKAPRLSPFFIHFNRIQFDQNTALAQVERF